MSEFEKFIRNNLEKFDDDLPDQKHLKKFQQKLRKVNDLQGSLPVVKIAAVILAGMVITAVSYLITVRNDYEEIISGVSPEMEETLFYYNSLNHNMIEEIHELPLEKSDEKEKIMEDIEKYDENFFNLMNDLQKYPADERVKNALIEHYRSKSEFLGYILDQLEKHSEKNI